MLTIADTALEESFELFILQQGNIPLVFSLETKSQCDLKYTFMGWFLFFKEIVPFQEFY